MPAPAETSGSFLKRGFSRKGSRSLAGDAPRPPKPTRRGASDGDDQRADLVIARPGGDNHGADRSDTGDGPGRALSPSPRANSSASSCDSSPPPPRAAETADPPGTPAAHDADPGLPPVPSGHDGGPVLPPVPSGPPRSPPDDGLPPPPRRSRSSGALDGERRSRKRSSKPSRAVGDGVEPEPSPQPTTTPEPPVDSEDARYTV